MIDHPRLFRSFGFAVEGIKYALKKDQNLRVHFTIAVLVIFLSIVLNVNPFEMGILGVMILLVIVTEMINSTIENMVDLITKEHRQEAKYAKDVAAGMVLITVIGSVIVGVLIFLPHLIKIIQ